MKNINISVDQKGNGDFKSINQALSFASSISDASVFISIKAGTYKENIEILRDNITLCGDFFIC